MAMLLSLRKYPTSIRYSKTSNNCHRLAERLSSCVSRERELFSQVCPFDVFIQSNPVKGDAIKGDNFEKIQNEMIIFPYITII